MVVGGIECRLRLSPRLRVPGNTVPAFATAAISLGRELYLSAIAGQPRTVVLALPTRDFFSALMALGAADAALTCGRRTEALPELGDLVVALCDTGRIYISIFEGVVEDSGSPSGFRTKLRLRGDQGISMYSSAVTLLRHPGGPDARATLSTLRSSQQAPLEVLTAQYAYGVGAVRDLYAETPASTIVGTKTRIEHELEEMRFALAERPDCDISLGDLLLTNQSRLLPPLVDVKPYTANDLEEMKPPLTILDGANVPLRHGVHLGNGSQAILLDSTTPQATLELAVSSSANQFAFYTQDPDWRPLHHKGLAVTERASYIRRVAL